MIVGISDPLRRTRCSVREQPAGVGRIRMSRSGLCRARCPPDRVPIRIGDNNRPPLDSLSRISQASTAVTGPMDGPARRGARIVYPKAATSRRPSHCHRRLRRAEWCLRSRELQSIRSASALHK